METTITEMIMVLVSVIMVMEPGQMKMGILIRNNTISLTELSKSPCFNCEYPLDSKQVSSFFQLQISI